jgi:hypothetical protein
MGSFTVIEVEAGNWTAWAARIGRYEGRRDEGRPRERRRDPDSSSNGESGSGTRRTPCRAGRRLRQCHPFWYRFSRTPGMRVTSHPARFWANLTAPFCRFKEGPVTHP